MNRKCIPVIALTFALSFGAGLVPATAQTLLRVATPGARPDLFPTEEAIVNVLKTMSYEDAAFGSIPPYKFFDLSLIQELKSEFK